MRWVRVEDNEEAWEYALAGLLWFGDPPDKMCLYDAEAVPRLWTKERWIRTRFDNTAGAYPNYIQVDD